jgi:ABC-type transport system substrate-binding protein
LLSPIFPKHYWEDRFEEAFASEDPVRTLLAFDGADEPSAGAFTFSRWEPGAFAEVAANPEYSFKGTITREYKDEAGAIAGYVEILPDGTTRYTGAAISTHDNTDPDNDPNTVDPCEHNQDQRIEAKSPAEHAVDKNGDGFICLHIDAELALELETGPFVDAVIYSLFGSQASAALAVVAGDIDYHFNPLGYGFETLRQLEETPGVRVLKNASNGVFYLSFNMRKSPFNYVEFRRAVRCVIDKEFVAEELLAGLVIPAYSPVPPGNAFWHRPLTPEEKEIACIGLSEEERLARARQMLTDAGFQFDEEGILAADPEGNPIAQQELLHPNAAYDNNRNIFGLHIVDRLQKLGVPVRDVPAGFNNIVTLVFDEQDFDMWQLGWGLGVYPDYLEAFYHSRNTAPGGNAPQGGVCGAREDALTGCQQEFDALADQFLAEQDARKAQEIAFELQRLVFHWAAYVPTHYVQQQDAYRADRINWQGLEDFPILDGMQAGAGYRSIVKKAASQ